MNTIQKVKNWHFLCAAEGLFHQCVQQPDCPCSHLSSWPGCFPWVALEGESIFMNTWHHTTDCPCYQLSSWPGCLPEVALEGETIFHQLLAPYHWLSMPSSIKLSHPWRWDNFSLTLRALHPLSWPGCLPLVGLEDESSFPQHFEPYHWLPSMLSNVHALILIYQADQDAFSESLLKTGPFFLNS